MKNGRQPLAVKVRAHLQPALAGREDSGTAGNTRAAGSQQRLFAISKEEEK
jgi:hypothetical protein